MNFINEVSEHKMVGAFLIAEIDSKRFNHHLLSLLHSRGLEESLIRTPDFSNQIENNIRKSLLDYRGYVAREALFASFPDNLPWSRVELELKEVMNLATVNDPEWVEKTSGTRRVSDAFMQLSKSPNDSIWGHINECAEQIGEGCKIPEILLVGTSVESMVILEGHLRALGYLKNNNEKMKVPAFVAISPSIKGWAKY